MSQNTPFPLGHGPAPQQQLSIAEPANGALSQSIHTATTQHRSVPGLDMSALQGITPQQLALIAHLLQTGQIPLPPPPPTSAIGLTPTQHAQPSQAPQDPLVSAIHNMEQDADIDKEEGEVEEGELGDAPAPRQFLRTPPKGPRNSGRSANSGIPGAHDLKHSSQRDPSTSALGTAVASRVPSGLNGGISASQVHGDYSHWKQLREDASIKAFVVEMQKAGIMFDQVAKEVSNVSGLRRLYQQLGIPVDSTNNVADIDVPKGLPNPSLDQSKVSVTKRSATSKGPVVQDRSTYLAKLQAAKNKKSESAVVAPVQVVNPPQELHPKVAKQEAAVAKTASPKISPDKTEILKQKLAAWRAQQAAKQEAAKQLNERNQTSLQGPPAVHTPQEHPSNEVNTTSRGIKNAAAISQSRSDTTPLTLAASNDDFRQTADLHIAEPRSVATTSASPTLNRGFGLPGLFTTLSGAAPGTQSFSSPGASASLHGTAPSVVQRPSLPKSISQTTIPSAVQSNYPINPAASRPLRTQSYGAGFYQATSWQQEPTETFVITDSGDEDSGEEMDIDDSEPDEPIEVPPKATAKLKVDASSVSTAVGTPSQGSKRDFSDMDLEQMKRQIARFEERRQKSSNGDGRPVGSTHDGNGNATPPSVSPSGGGTPTADAVLVDGRPAPAHAASKRAEVQALRQRLLMAEREIAAKTRGSGTLTPGAAARQIDGLVDSSQTALTPSARPSEVTDAVNLDAETTGADEPNHLTSDEDEAMYADPARNTTFPLQTVESSRHSSQQTRQSENLADVSVLHGTNADAPLSHDISGTDAEAVEDAHSSWSEEDDEMYQVTSTPRNEALAHAIPTENLSNGDAEHETDDDDMDDVYEPTNPVTHPIPMPTTAAIETSSDEFNEGEDSSEGEGDTHEEGEDDSEDAMDTSDDSESDSDGPNHEKLQNWPGTSRSPLLEHPATEFTDTDVAMEPTRMADDLAPELQPSGEELAVLPDESRERPSFHSYESPLAKFKDFRFHPDYLNTVSGGYKSLTFCHKINPDAPVCPWEAAGGACHDKTCEYQHFRSMGLTDNDLLRSMGAESVPAQTPEEDARWKSGLGKIIQELRTTHQNKDVLAIARRIAEYRREFRGDPTKTLLLD